MSAYIVQEIDGCTVVEFTTVSLMDPMELERIGVAMYHLVDAEDRRIIVLDFAKVQFVSSQAIGIIMAMRKKLAALKKSALVLCGVGAKMLEILHITGLDRHLTIKPSQQEAVKFLSSRNA